MLKFKIIISNFIASFGRWWINLCYNFGSSGKLLFNILINKQNFDKQTLRLIKQIYNLGVLSLIIIIVSGLFIGIVLGIQGHITLATYGAESNLESMISLSLLRELGPVITALLFTGRSASALTAEIGLLKATEQLSSLEMMAIDPLNYIGAPRFWATIISIPLLTIIFVISGIWGSTIINIEYKNINNELIWFIIDNIENWKQDIINCIIKSLFFAITIAWISLFNGYKADPTSEGISKATTKTVINASLAILGLDVLLTILMFGTD